MMAQCAFVLIDSMTVHRKFEMCSLSCSWDNTIRKYCKKSSFKKTKVSLLAQYTLYSWKTSDIFLQLWGLHGANNTVLVMPTVGARQTAVHRQFDSVATMMWIVQSPEEVRDWTSSVTASKMTPLATDCSSMVQMCCCRHHLCHYLLSSDATMPSSAEEHPHSNLSHQHSITIIIYTVSSSSEAEVQIYLNAT